MTRELSRQSFLLPSDNFNRAITGNSAVVRIPIVKAKRFQCPLSLQKGNCGQVSFHLKNKFLQTLFVNGRICHRRTSVHKLSFPTMPPHLEETKQIEVLDKEEAQPFVEGQLVKIRKTSEEETKRCWHNMSGICLEG